MQPQRRTLPDTLLIRNHWAGPVHLFHIDPQERRKPAAILATGEEAVMTSRAGLTWLVESADGKAIGHFIVPETRAGIWID